MLTLTIIFSYGRWRGIIHKGVTHFFDTSWQTDFEQVFNDCKSYIKQYDIKDNIA